MVDSCHAGGVIAVGSCVSACTTLGPPGSNPSAMPPDGGYAGMTARRMATAAVEPDYEEEKSMLARRLTTILPALTLAEAIETAYPPRRRPHRRPAWALVTTRPFRAPTRPSRTPG